MPTPYSIFRAFFRVQNELWVDFYVTTIEIVLGFFIGAVVGMLMGIGIAYSKTLESVLYPAAIVVKVIPIIAIAPILTLWFGYGMTSKIVITATVTFFPLVVNTAVGLKSVDTAMIDLLNSLSANEWHTFIKVRLPSALPFIFSALKIAITVGVIGAIVGEYVGAIRGLGYLSLQAISYIDTPLLFLILVILAMLGLVLFASVVIVEKVFFPWSSEIA